MIPERSTVIESVRPWKKKISTTPVRVVNWLRKRPPLAPGSGKSQASVTATASPIRNQFFAIHTFIVTLAPVSIYGI
jgi:hypothetical protein